MSHAASKWPHGFATSIMSLGIIIKGPEGIVLAAESRVTLTAQVPGGPSIHVNFDNATKVLTFSKPNDYIGVVTYGQAAIGRRTAHSFIPEFESDLKKNGGKGRLTVETFAKKLSAFYLKQWQTIVKMPPEYKGPPMTFLVGGFDINEPYGKVYEINIPYAPTPVEQMSDTQVDEKVKKVSFGLTWGGQREIVDRLLMGHDPRVVPAISKNLSLDATQQEELSQTLRRFGIALPIDAMALQDCIDTALFLIRTTIAAQKLTVGVRGCGGPIDVAVITSNAPLAFVQRKKLHGEINNHMFYEEEV